MNNKPVETERLENSGHEKGSKIVINGIGIAMIALILWGIFGEYIRHAIAYIIVWAISTP